MIELEQHEEQHTGPGRAMTYREIKAEMEKREFDTLAAIVRGYGRRESLFEAGMESARAIYDAKASKYGYPALPA